MYNNVTTTEIVRSDLSELCIQADTKPTASVVIPMIVDLRKGLIEAKAAISVHVPNFPVGVVDAVWSDFVDRWGEGVAVCTFGQEGTGRQPRAFTKEQVIATALDIRFCEHLPGVPESEKEQVWEVVTSALTELIVAEQPNEGGGDGESEPTNEDDMPVFEAHEADSAEMIAKREVGRFRQVKSKKDACPLEWWRDKGSVARERGGGVVWGWLSKLARRALAMPATSAAAERLFSQASSAFQASRKRIKVVNSLVMLFLHQVPQSRTRIEYA